MAFRLILFHGIRWKNTVLCLALTNVLTNPLLDEGAYSGFAFVGNVQYDHLLSSSVCNFSYPLLCHNIEFNNLGIAEFIVEFLVYCGIRRFSLFPVFIKENEFGIGT